MGKVKYSFIKKRNAGGIFPRHSPLLSYVSDILLRLLSKWAKLPHPVINDLGQDVRSDIAVH